METKKFTIATEKNEIMNVEIVSITEKNLMFDSQMSKAKALGLLSLGVLDFVNIADANVVRAEIPIANIFRMWESAE